MTTALPISLTQAQHRYLDVSMRIWICAGVPFALLGNATSDIWLSATAALFILIHGLRNAWCWTRTPWFQVAGLFWAWVLIVSAFSNWPFDALPEALAWVRFPIFALALSSFLISYPGLFRQFAWTVIAGLIILTFILISEKVANPEAKRLYGTWSQNTKIGWLVVGFGLPASYLLFERIIKQQKAALWAAPLICLLFVSCVLTGEIYVTLSFLLGLILITLVSRPDAKVMMALVILTSSTCVIVFYLHPELAQHFYRSLTTRIPWMSESDYFQPWMRGIEIFKQHFIFGIGAHNFESYCRQSAEIFAIGSDECHPHPHQLYIQIASETGLVGLTLFISMIFLLARQIVQQATEAGWPFSAIAALCLLTIVLWPISTYSNAFGQHKNFFTWFGIAWALYLGQSARQGHAHSNHNQADQPV